MKFNKKDQVNRYYNLDEILKLDLPDNVKQNMKEKFGKTVSFDLNESCKVGKLCGLEKNYQLTMLYYIIKGLDSKKMYIPIQKSITVL